MEAFQREASAIPRRSGTVLSMPIFVYDVADTIDFTQLGSVAGTGVARAPSSFAVQASAGSIAYPTPPIAVALPASDGLGIRAKVFDYGIVSIRITRPFAGSWQSFAA